MAISKTDRASVLKNLKSNDQRFALKAIDRIKKGGDVTFMDDILTVLLNTTEVSIENAIAQLLFDLKDKAAVEELVNQLSNEKYGPIRVIMLSACWQTGFDLGHRLPDLISVASTGSYVECLEVLTIIENWEAVVDQEMLVNEILRLKAFLSESDTPEKDEMIFSIIEVMEGFLIQ